MGVNWSFSPVTDMLNNFFDVMGVRCISDNADTVARLAAAMVRGLENEGAATSPKHFPGSGNDYRDTHFCAAENNISPELSEEENAQFDALNYEIAKSALTLINNKTGTIPFDPVKHKSALIVAYSPYEPFVVGTKELAKEFARRGIKADIVTGLETKDELEAAAEKYDLIIYAAYLAMAQPTGMPFFSSNFSTLFNTFSYGAEKSVAASFGASLFSTTILKPHRPT